MSSNNYNEVQDERPTTTQLPSLASVEFWHSGNREDWMHALSAECQRLLQRSDETASTQQHQPRGSSELQASTTQLLDSSSQTEISMTENNALEAEINELKQKVRMLTDDGQNKEKQTKELEGVLNVATTSAMEAAQKLQVHQQKLKQEHKEAVETLVEALRAEKEKLEKILEDARKKDDEIEELKKKVNSESSRATLADEAVQKLQTDKDKLEEEYMNDMRDLKKALKDNQEGLEKIAKDVKNKEGEIEELKKSVSSEIVKATEAAHATDQLRKKLQKQQDEHEKRVEQEHKKEIEDLKGALAAEKRISEADKVELKKLTEELQSMHLKNKELKNNVTTENSRATGAVQEAQVLQEKLQQALKELEGKKKELLEQENAHKLRMDQFEDDTKKRHKKEIKALEVEVKKRNATIKEHQVAAQERRAKHDAEVEELEQKLATEEEKCRRIVQDIREKLDAQFPPISRSPSTECVWPEMIIDDVFWQQPSSSTSHVYSSFAFSTPRSSSQNAPVQEEATSHQSTSSEPASSAPNSNSSPNSSARITRRHAPPSTSRASKRIAAKNAQEEPTKKPK
eukprot:NP_494598.2 Uncharacterized protein CELE_M151.4 [Caenorhabditis elegans]